MNENKGRMWGVLVHLGMNQWRDHVQEMKPKGCWSRVPEVILRHMSEQYCAADHVRFDEAVWREVSVVYAREGVNTIVLDLGEAVAYPSHPELAVRGSWSVDKLRAELARLRGMGFEVIPKLNFSSTHDAWLGDYHRMLSTPDYYRVCSDVIRDVCEMFGGPRLFHIGFDEERASSRDHNAMIVVRQGELWWHDLLFMIGEVEKHGARPMMWVDYLVKESGRSGVFGRLPKSVLVQPW